MGGPRFAYEAPNWIGLNRTTPSQSMSCITKTCEVSALLRYRAALSGNSLLTFQDYLLVQSSRVKKSKTTQHD
jgi:hypothetical protein